MISSVHTKMNYIYIYIYIYIYNLKCTLMCVLNINLMTLCVCEKQGRRYVVLYCITHRSALDQFVRSKNQFKNRIHFSTLLQKDAIIRVTN